MTITHHIPAEIIAVYAAGSLSQAYAVVVASHVSLCGVCRTELAAQEAAGDVALDATESEHSGIFLAPIMAALSGSLPKWRSLGRGVKQCVIGGGGGISRLLSIPAGQAVPDHGHNGLELTLVLQGGFSDATGHYDVGDVEVADIGLEHRPVADAGQPCIVLVATDAPLRFTTFLPRLLQPLFGI